MITARIACPDDTRNGRYPASGQLEDPCNRSCHLKREGESVQEHGIDPCIGPWDGIESTGWKA